MNLQTMEYWNIWDMTFLFNWLTGTGSMLLWKACNYQNIQAFTSQNCSVFTERIDIDNQIRYVTVPWKIKFNVDRYLCI